MKDKTLFALPVVILVLALFLKTIKHKWFEEGTLGDLVFEHHKIVGREFEGSEAGGVQIDFSHELLAKCTYYLC